MDSFLPRWRGENVSTTEVEAVVSNMVQLKDAVVYGVEIPGTEGRAGMAAIHDPQEEVDMSELARAIQIELPSFSRPLFVRVVKHLDITGESLLRYQPVVSHTKANSPGKAKKNHHDSFMYYSFCRPFHVKAHFKAIVYHLSS